MAVFENKPDFEMMQLPKTKLLFPGNSDGDLLWDGEKVTL